MPHGQTVATVDVAMSSLDPGQQGLVLPRLGSEPARRAEAGRFATWLTGPILGKVAVPMTIDST